MASVRLVFPPTQTARARIITGISALLASVAWIAKDIGGRITPDPNYWNCSSSYDYALNAIDTMAFLSLGVALIGLCTIFRAAIGEKMAWIGAIAAVSFGVTGFANLLEHCAGLDELGILYVIGLMLGMLLLIAFGLLLTRVHVPTGFAWFLVVGPAAAILLSDQGGFIAFGLSWGVLGVALLRKSRKQT
jgi:hypothetical protein